MSLVGRWEALQAELPDGWSNAALRLELREREAADRAAALLGPAQPIRVSPAVLRFDSARDGSAPSPDSLARLLRRLDDARVIGDLALAGTRTAPAQVERPIASLVDAWDAALAVLPSDWSDLYGEFTLLSTDYVDRAAVLCVPMNPRREGTRAALRFRGARRAGYGVSPQMVRRCFERLEAEQMRGSVTILRVLSDTRLVATQGPTWLGGGSNF